ncbi:MAG: DsrE/DsrF/DrsH-like family protein [Sporichthyaceae bacterium]
MRHRRRRHPAVEELNEIAAGAAADIGPDTKSLAIVCWSNDLDRVWPTLILATTGAASGMQVDVFATFWGLRVLQRDERRVTGPGWAQKGVSLLDRGGVSHLRLGKLHAGGFGTRMVRRLARRHQMPDPAELLATALELGVRIHPCQTSMDLYGLTREDMIDGLGPTMGAASFLAIAADADITLFI